MSRRLGANAVLCLRVCGFDGGVLQLTKHSPRAASRTLSLRYCVAVRVSVCDSLVRCRAPCLPLRRYKTWMEWNFCVSLGGEGQGAKASRGQSPAGGKMWAVLRTLPLCCAD